MVLPQQLEGPGPRLINEGDLVIIYESYTSIKSVYINTKSTYSSRYGNFLHKVSDGRLGPCAAAAAFVPPTIKSW